MHGISKVESTDQIHVGISLNQEKMMDSRVMDPCGRKVRRTEQVRLFEPVYLHRVSLL